MNIKQYDAECHKLKKRIDKCKDEVEKQKITNQLTALKIVYQIKRIINKFETDETALMIYSDDLKLIKSKLFIK